MQSKDAKVLQDQQVKVLRAEMYILIIRILMLNNMNWLKVKESDL